MHEIIYKYLDKNYSFTNSTNVKYVLLDNIDNSEISISTVFKIIIKIFDISIENVTPIFDKWADEKAIEYNNRAWYKYGI